MKIGAEKNPNFPMKTCTIFIMAKQISKYKIRVSKKSNAFYEKGK